MKLNWIVAIFGWCHMLGGIGCAVASVFNGELRLLIVGVLLEIVGLFYLSVVKSLV